MVLVNELKQLIREKGFSQREMAQILGMSETTFCRRLKKGVFTSTEMETMVRVLELEHPEALFFAPKVT